MTAEGFRGAVAIRVHCQIAGFKRLWQLGRTNQPFWICPRMPSENSIDTFVRFWQNARVG
jgi:hypothetical protein